MKEEILRMLCTHRGNYVSGAALATQLKVSKVAIWKHIQVLRGDGYSIESRRRRGYRLTAAPDLLLPYEVRRELQTKFIGGKIFHYWKVNSTQKVAKELAMRGAEEGTLVVAETQSAGKGRRNRNWYSPKGGIYLSLIMKSEMSPSKASLMTLLTGVAVAKTIREIYGLKAELKWPNDIQISDRKIGGILIEFAAETEFINWLVMGIGLNANIKRASLPREFRATTTSLEEECGRKISRVNFVRKFLEKIEKLYLIFKRRGGAPILEEWKSMTNTLGAWVRVEDGEAIEGKAVDIDRNGALIIKLADGTTKRIVSGDVSLRKERGTTRSKGGYFRAFPR